MPYPICSEAASGIGHFFLEILEPVLRDAGQEMWQALERIISAKNAMEGYVAKEMYIRGFLKNALTIILYYYWTLPPNITNIFNVIFLFPVQFIQSTVNKFYQDTLKCVP